MPVTTDPADRFEAIVRHVTPTGLGYLARRCDPPADAADLWQPVLITAWRRLDDLPDDPGAQTAWFVRAARHELSHHHRSRARRDAATTRLAILLSTQPRHRPGPDAVHDPADDGVPDVGPLLERLDDIDREVVRLTYWEGLSSEQIGVVIGRSPAAVRKRLQRARDAMRATRQTTPPLVSDPA